MLLKEDTNGFCTELKNHYASLQNNMEFRSIAPYIQQAQIKFLQKIIGKEQLEDIDTKYNNTNYTLTSAEQELLTHLQRTLTYYTLADNLLYLDSFIGDAGAVQANTSEVSVIPQWKFNAIQKNLYDSADEFAEQTLQFLEENIADFPAYQNSETYQASKELLINTAQQLNELLPIKASRTLFLKVRIFLKIVEKNELAAIFSTELIEEIKTATSPTDKQKVVKELLTQITAYTAFQKCLTAINLQSGEQGLYISSYTDTQKKQEKLDQENKNILREEYKNLSQKTTETLLKYLENNIIDFPTFQTSNAYISPELKAENIIRDSNEGKKNFSF